MEENLIFVPGEGLGREFLVKVFFQDLNCNQITVTINNNRDYWKKFFPGKEGGKWKMRQKSKDPPNFQGYGNIRGKLEQSIFQERPNYDGYIVK